MRSTHKSSFDFCPAPYGPLPRPAAHSTHLVGRSCLLGAQLLVLLLGIMLLSTAAQAQLARPLVELNLQPPTGPADPVTVYFEAGATEGLDSNFDAEKLTNPSGLNLASFALTGERLSVDGLPPTVLAVPYTVKLFVGVPQFATYELAVGQLANFSSTQVFLNDALLSTSTPLVPGSTYPFDITAVNTNGTYIANERFTLLFLPTAAPLPVTLTAFTAQAQLPGVALAWHTAAEWHSAHFAVERSADGQAFTEIGQVAAAGTSGLAHSYAFYDPLPLGGTAYYRLRQVDLDGSSQYSPVRVVAGPAGTEELLVFPNPARAGSTLRGLGAGEQVQIFNALGQAVVAAQAEDNGTFVLPASLPSGTYVVRSGKQTTRLLVK